MAEYVALLSGIIVSVMVEVAKRVSAIPLDPEKKGAVRGTAFVLSFLAAFFAAWASGTLESPDFLSYVQALAGGIATYLVSWVSYKLLLKKAE